MKEAIRNYELKRRGVRCHLRYANRKIYGLRGHVGADRAEVRPQLAAFAIHEVADGAGHLGAMRIEFAGATYHVIK